MKKLYALGVLISVASMSYAKVSSERIEREIQASNVSRVKSLLRKLDREKQAPQEKKTLLEGLYEEAEEVSDTYRENLSIYGHWKDITKSSIGAALGVIGLGYTVGSGDPTGLILLIPAVPLLYKGLRCSTQQGLIEQASKVERLIENALDAVELPES